MKQTNQSKVNKSKVNKMKENKNVAPLAQLTTSDSSEKKRTPVQEVMRAYKQAKGIDPDNAKWDKIHFGRYLRPAQQLLVIFDGDHLKAVEYMKTKGKEWDELADWGLDGIVRAASRDPNLYEGSTIPVKNSEQVVDPKTFFRDEEEVK